MSSTITGTTVTTGVTFGAGTYSSPLTITSSGGVSNATGDAVRAAGTYANPTLVNYGRVTGSGDGVDFEGGGSVANMAGLIQGSQDGVYIGGAAGSVTNAGTIAGTGSLGVGVRLGAGGGVATGTGLIEGYYTGVGIYGVAGTVTNAATIAGTGSIAYGIVLFAGGSVANTGTGLIQAVTGVDIFGATGTVTNAATIAGTGGFGVVLFAGGSVANTGTGLIQAVIGVDIRSTAGTVTNSATIAGTGSYGVRLAAGGTVVDSGTISGANGTAIYFGGPGANRLVLDPGYKLTGVVVGSTTAGASNTLELASATGAGTMSAALHTEFSHFGVVNVDVGVQWTLTGTSSLAGVTLTDFGTLTNRGYISGTVTLAGASYLDNSDTIAAVGSAVYGSTSPNTVVNSGTIAGTGSLGVGVRLGAGGGVANTGTGLIEGYYTGVGIYGTAGTVANAATIAGTGSIAYGIVLFAGGSVANTGTGLIQAFTGVDIFGAAGTVTNAATIAGTGGFGVVLFAGGSVANTGTGLIQGNTGVDIRSTAGTVTNSATIAGTGSYGVRLAEGGTVVDSGTISGANGTAIYFIGSGNHLLELLPGYALSGMVIGFTLGPNTLELSGSVGAPLTVDSTALGLTNFHNFLFDPSGNDTLKVSGNTGGTFGTVSGFTLGSDIIDLTAVGANGTVNSTDLVNHRVTITGAAGSETLQFNAKIANITTHPDGTGGTDVVACYRRGTMILTPDGEVAVEELAIGDLVTVLSGEARPVRWIGHRAYGGRFIAGNRQVLPIRVTAGALAEGVPARDLWVSPGHALYLDGVLVQAEHLVNGATIVQADNVDMVEYFHIELDTHDIVFADGAAAETFTDCDNRYMFTNGPEYAALYPGDNRPAWEFCVPRLEWDDPALSEIRTALLWRAEALGHELDGDPDLHLIVDDAILLASGTEGRVHRFVIPADASYVCFASRSSVPAEIDPASCDGRRLGVPVERIVLTDGELRIEIGHRHPILCDGFHGAEPGHRWTDGLGRLPESLLRPFPGTAILELHLAPSALRYRCPPIRTKHAAA